MSKKISELTHLEPPLPVLGTDLIPIARPTTSPMTNFSVSVDRIINKKKFCLLSSYGPQTHIQDFGAPDSGFIPNPWYEKFTYRYSPLRLDSFVAGEQSWFNYSALYPKEDLEDFGNTSQYGPHQIFKPLESGYYKIDGSFVFSHNAEVPKSFIFMIGMNRAGVGFATYRYYQVGAFPNLRTYNKFIFSEIVQINNPEDYYTFSIATMEEYNAGTGLRIDIVPGFDSYYYNKWFVLFEKI